MVINGWVGPFFCELYYILTSFKLEFEWFWWWAGSPKLWVKLSLHELLVSWNCDFDKFYEFLEVQAISDFTLWHIFLTIFYYFHNTTDHSQFQNMRDKKIIKKRLGCNLLCFHVISLEHVVEKSPENLS